MRAQQNKPASQHTTQRTPHTKKIGYLRTSTAEQSVDRQVDGLTMICDELHIECLSAVSARRPVYERVMDRLRPGDMFVIWDLDRAYRSAKDALNELDRLRERGVEFVIANLNLDTTTPHGRLIYTVMGALAQFERENLSQRTREGLAAAKRRGKRLGRPPKLNALQLKDARKRMALGETTREVAYRLGVVPWTLRRALKRLEHPNR